MPAKARQDATQTTNGKVRLPLFIVCQNPACGKLKQVRRPSEQKRYRYCGHVCAGTMHNGLRTLTKAQRQATAEKTKRIRRERAMAKLAGMSPLEIYRMGFSVGWKAGVRRANRTFQEKQQQRRVA